MKTPLVKTKLYMCWKNMRNRCRMPERWGGIVQVCDRWNDTSSDHYHAPAQGFLNFKEDMVGYFEGATLQRRDITKEYCPENCFWSNKKRPSTYRRRRAGR